MTTTIDTRKTCTYPGDARASLGQVKGPNAWGELLVVDEVEYRPTGPCTVPAHTTGITRVWFRYATAPELAVAAAAPQPDMATPAFDLPAWLVGAAGWVEIACDGCGTRTRQHGITDPSKGWALCPDCLNQPWAHARVETKRREIRAAAAGGAPAGEPPADDPAAPTMTPVTIRIVGLASGEMATPFDGQWLVEYDPTRPGVAPDGRPLTAHIVTTDDRAQAARFPHAQAAWQEWRRESGHPYPANAPLTAFTITVAPVDMDDDLPDTVEPWDGNP